LRSQKLEEKLDTPKPPSHLSKPAKALSTSIAATYILESHHYHLLTLAMEASDRCEDARQAIARDGLMVVDRYGASKLHPAVSAERDSRLAVARLLRELALDVDKPDESRPPGLRYIHGGR